MFAQNMHDQIGYISSESYNQLGKTTISFQISSIVCLELLDTFNSTSASACGMFD